MTLPFGANIDIHNLVRNMNMMKEYGFRPNGGILTSCKGADFFIRINVVPNVPNPWRLFMYFTNVGRHFSNCAHNLSLKFNFYMEKQKDKSL